MLEDGLKPAVLRACVQEFLTDAPRMERLWQCYSGRHDILHRKRAQGMPNHRLVHDFPRYICTMAAGYLVGKPIAYETDESEQDALEDLKHAYAHCAIDSVDAELARAASIYGRGVELIFADEDACPRSAALDPRFSFVVYDDTVEHRPLLGVCILPDLDDLGGVRGWRLEVCTAAERFSYASAGLGEPGRLLRRENHYFGGVPMVEYWNGEDERGDFEGVLTLIDAYDTLQSDRVNDKSQFVDALLLLYGCTMDQDEQGRTPGEQLREDKLLTLPDADAHAEWLCKQLNEADTEVLKNALAQDIHKLSMVPDLSDERFGGNLSGVAMRYKLLGLEQLAQIKERWFREALRQRAALFSNFMALKGGKGLDADHLRMIFTRSLPVNNLEEAQVLQALKDVLPHEELQRRAEERM